MKEFKAFVVKNKKEAEQIINSNNGVPVAIECEWGDIKLDNVFINLNHHGKEQNNNPPSVLFADDYILKINNPFFIYSHVDLDVIIGTMWLLGELNKKNLIHTSISKLTAIADKYGPHFVKENWESDTYKKWVTIGWLVNRNNKGIIGDVTNLLKDIFKTIKGIMEDKNIDNNPMFNEAYEWKTKVNKNATEKIKYSSKYVLGFVSDKFMLSNYFLLNKVRPVLVQYNPFAKRVSISAINDNIAKKLFGESGVETVLKKHFGNESGGRVSIGGSPRFKEITYSEFKDFIKDVDRIISKNITKEMIEILNNPT